MRSSVYDTNYCKHPNCKSGPNLKCYNIYAEYFSVKILIIAPDRGEVIKTEYYQSAIPLYYELSNGREYMFYTCLI